MTFALPDPTDTLTIKLTVSKTGSDKGDCEIDWDDGLTDNDKVDGVLMIEHTYLKVIFVLRYCITSSVSKKKSSYCDR